MALNSYLSLTPHGGDAGSIASKQQASKARSAVLLNFSASEQTALQLSARQFDDWLARTPNADAIQSEAMLHVIGSAHVPRGSASSAPLYAAGVAMYSSVMATIANSLDSMGDLSEMASMRLQMAMDRRSKFVEALSNIMKKIDGTQETILQNMK